MDDGKSSEGIEETPNLCLTSVLPDIGKEILFLEVDLTPVDAFHPSAAEYRFLGRYRPLIAYFKKTTKFSNKEIESLMLLFHKFTNQREIMLKDDFIDILGCTLGLTDEFINDKIIIQILEKSNIKRFITMDVWVQVFSLFLRGSQKAKRKFCFGVYDITKKGFIGRDVAYQ